MSDLTLNQLRNNITMSVISEFGELKNIVIVENNQVITT